MTVALTKRAKKLETNSLHHPESPSRDLQKKRSLYEVTAAILNPKSQRVSVPSVSVELMEKHKT